MRTIGITIARVLKLNTIHKKFSYPILSLVSILLILSTFISVQIEKSEGQSDITDKGTAIAKLASLSLMDSVWNFNQAGIKTSADSLFNDKEVYLVVLTAADGKEIYKKTRDNTAQEKAGLIHVKDSIEKDGSKIGNIQIGITKYYLNEKINKERIASSVNCIVTILLLFMIITLVSRAVTKPLKELISVSDKISGGDYSSRSKIKSTDEIGTLSERFNNMAQNICDNLSQLKDTGSKLESYVNKLKSTHSSITEISSSVSVSSEDLAASGEELNATIEEISSNANVISQVVSRLFKTTEETTIKSDKIVEITTAGKGIIDETINKINSVAKAFEDIENKVKSLDQKSMEIKSFTDIISNIASQTNLIALNAAIEASRAGDSGRGFSVVADEIRKLSEQSSEATAQINQIINHINRGIQETVLSTEKGSLEVRDGVSLTLKAGESLEDIYRSISDTILLIREIEEKSQNADDGVRHVASSCEEFAKAIEQVALSSQNLSSLAVKLYSTASQANVMEQ